MSDTPNAGNARGSVLAEAIRDVCWKATPFGVRDDDSIASYLIPAGAMHRLVGAAQGAGISASFRAAPGPATDACTVCGSPTDGVHITCTRCAFPDQSDSQEADEIRCRCGVVLPVAAAGEHTACVHYDSDGRTP